MKLKVIKDTVFKQSPVQAIDLPENEKVALGAGRVFEIDSYKDIGSHIRVALEKTFLKGRNTWVAYQEHIEIIGDDGVKRIGKFSPNDKLPKQVRLPVPYFSQLNNRYKPEGTCNVTCVAMCLYYYGIRPALRNKQLEDELFQLVDRNGWDRHVHDHLRRVFLEYDMNDVFKMDATWNEIKAHLANGNPVIYPGRLTGGGHIIVLRGYDDTGFFVNDPYGEYFDSGYQTDMTGENLHYSYNLVKSKSYGESGTTWAHFPKKK
ncbi:C39 family peptidase [Argonema galeatum]|uniref:C39 family peptidase n=1 Tax=Argonema galeatum TaxID=2942762 RepID=UPI0020135FC5|nr:C39 family peptidase [Argonema galeatum]MCL1466517.1 C39 family peptidase [Argonema galeatum A003/A1]